MIRPIDKEATICIAHPETTERTYLVSDGEDVSTPELIRKVAVAVGKPARLFSVPPSLLRLAGRLTGKSETIDRLIGSLTVDSSKIRKELDWKPPYTMEQGLRETAEWFKVNSLLEKILGKK
jgi:nucleoside-diphosphate-sugar epimerase